MYEFEILLENGSTVIPMKMLFSGLDVNLKRL